MASPSPLHPLATLVREMEEQVRDRHGEMSEEVLTELYRAVNALQAQIADYLPEPATTASARAPQFLAQSHEFERSLRITQESVDGAPIGIFRLDGEGRVVTVNREACRQLGYTREELESLTIYDFAAEITPEKWKEHRAVTKETGARTLTTVHRRKDGSIFPVEVSVRQFFFEGELCSVSFAKDISDRVNAEQERKKLEFRMLQAQKLESLGVLAGGIAHDFNNLLMVIIGNLELMDVDLPPSVGARDMLREADRAAKQAADLCRQLLIYAGKGTSKIEPTDLRKLLRDQAQMLELSASKSARLLLNLAEGLPPINADVSQLRQVFMNLIINASDAIGEATGVISITTSALSCEQDYLDGFDSAVRLAPGRYVSVEVADTGCGMDPAVRARIFDPFFSTKTTSRGLGLAAVRGIVNNHGGGIRVYSEPGKGTTFRLLFPVPGVLSTAASGAEKSTGWKGSGLVLLIDDEEALRSLGRRMLARLGFETLVASNGVEGLALFKAHAADIRYVLLDLTMPEMGGDETLRELRRLAPNVRVVLASGHAPDDILRRIGVGRASAFVRKPYSMDELAHAFETAARPDDAA